MPSRARLTWNGDKLIAQVRNAARESVDETVDAARDDAETTHAWKNDPRLRTHRRDGAKFDSHLELEIKSEHADPADRNPTARFGFTKRKGFYGLFHEEGTVREHIFPALRPAADRQFPTVIDRLREKLR